MRKFTACPTGLDMAAINHYISKMRLLVHLLTKFDERFINRLKSQLESGVDITVGEDIPSPVEYHILISGAPKAEHITASPNLHTLIIPWVGLPEKTRELMLKYPNITVHNIHHNDAPVAEMAITLMLSAAKNIIPIDRSIRNNDWTLRYAEKINILMENKTVLILGYGIIGKRIGKICSAMGMKILGIKNNVIDDNDSFAQVYKPTELHSLLPRANVFFITLPLTPETNNMIDEKELKLLPDKAIIVNIARGKIINEKALYDELKGGRISAGLDVWYDYPYKEEERKNKPPSQYDFSKLDNVVMTPHLAGHAIEIAEMRADKLADLLNIALSGKPLPNKVDIIRGY